MPYNIFRDSILHYLVTAGERHGMSLVRCSISKWIDTEEILPSKKNSM